MSLFTHDTTVPSYVYLSMVGMVGLGLASVFGGVQFWKRRSRTEGTLKEIGRRADEVSSLKKTLKDLQDVLKSREEEMLLLRQQAERMKKEMLELERQFDSSRIRNQSLGDRVRALEMEKQKVHDEKERIDLESAQIRQLLDCRTAELKGAEAFLTKADSLSGAEVISLVEALNSEILQTAAFMAESFQFEEKNSITSNLGEMSKDTKEAYAAAEEILGTRMVELLRLSEHHEDPMLVQIAFQASIAAYAHWIIASWYFEDPEDEHLLSEIYARVRESEEQAISGRWRALTRIHLQRMLAHEPDLSIYMVDAFVHVLITAGLRDSAAVLHERIMSEFLDRILLILRAAVRLNKIIGEGITSCDLEVFYVAPDILFNPPTMDDAYGSPAASEYEAVLCTTDLGLVRAERRPGKDAEWNESVLLKPKVVLPSGLQDVDNVDVGQDSESFA
ncbi:hypothetical protein BDQ12DRAFT_674251 [Crucibulum laeve]|uniref:Uncharacterized protein n=1 Tax=Crucibulum laeve TaxID=68775 RepID=A0A5C3MMH0_9AGAR|nr:hypothetical protein BDQ12DRAFT_674251 [Crucibulum laeve]